MIDTNEYSEKRRDKRFQVMSGAFAVNSKFGQIIDISMGGVSFRYVDRDEWENEREGLGILFGEDDLCLDKVPMQTVSDQVINNGVSSSATVVRRRGVKFGTLTAEQKFQLEYFIWVNTTGEYLVNCSA